MSKPINSFRDNALLQARPNYLWSDLLEDRAAIYEISSEKRRTSLLERTNTDIIYALYKELFHMVGLGHFVEIDHNQAIQINSVLDFTRPWGFVTLHGDKLKFQAYKHGVSRERILSEYINLSEEMDSLAATLSKLVVPIFSDLPNKETAELDSIRTNRLVP